MPQFYSQPRRLPFRLEVPPALASWDRATSPGQIKSRAFIEHAWTVLREGIDGTPDPLALRLDIALPDTVPLLNLNDLDNYLFPLVPTLTKRSGRQFASVSATKRHAVESFAVVGHAEPVPDPGGTYAIDVRTTTSTATTAFKEEIRDQVAAANPLPEGGIALQLAFVIGPIRAWPNLWKPTIDALGPILGWDEGAGQWNTRDGRITKLHLHCLIDPSRRTEIDIAIRASPADD